MRVGVGTNNNTPTTLLRDTNGFVLCFNEPFVDSLGPHLQDDYSGDDGGDEKHEEQEAVEDEGHVPPLPEHLVLPRLLVLLSLNQRDHLLHNRGVRVSSDVIKTRHRMFDVVIVLDGMGR